MSVCVCAFVSKRARPKAMNVSNFIHDFFVFRLVESRSGCLLLLVLSPLFFSGLQNPQQKRMGNCCIERKKFAPFCRASGVLDDNRRGLLGFWGISLRRLAVARQGLPGSGGASFFE